MKKSPIQRIFELIEDGKTIQSITNHKDELIQIEMEYYGEAFANGWMKGAMGKYEKRDTFYNETFNTKEK